MPRPGDYTILTAARDLADGRGPTPGWDQATPCEDNPAFFFSGADFTRAQRICDGCPVQLDCAADGIRTARAGLDPGVRAGIGSIQIRRASTIETTGRAARRAVRERAARAAATGATIADLAAAHQVSERTIERWLADVRGTAA